MGDRLVISAFTEEQVSRLTGISVGQLRYWDRTDFFCPGLRQESTPGGRLYSYLDLVALKVIARLRRDVPLQHLRVVKERLQAINPEIWRGLTLWVDGRKVAFIDPVTGGPEQVVSGQKLLTFPLSETIDDLDADIQRLRVRDPGTIGGIEKRRPVLRNRPVIAGTRIPVEAIRSFHEAGYDTDRILAEYPALTAEDVTAALQISDDAA